MGPAAILPERMESRCHSKASCVPLFGLQRIASGRRSVGYMSSPESAGGRTARRALAGALSSLR